MSRARLKTFKSGNSTAVILPKVLEVDPGIELEAERNGEVITLRPVRISMAELARRLEALPKPSRVQKRPPFEYPHRPGLFR